jgi:ATP-dependent Clp protease ATP-binding subunit ClpA
MPFINDRLADPEWSAGPLDADGSLAAIEQRLRAGIVGQPAAIEAVMRIVALHRAGMRAERRPWGSILLAGRTGVGKTELVRLTAAALRSGPDDMCRIDMGALAQEHYAASFAGAPPGYAGSKEGHSLFERSTVEGSSFAPGIVLFDEVEKAHAMVLRSLLHILDHGELRLANGQQRILFHNSIVFMTSNLGARELDARLLRAARGIASRIGTPADRAVRRREQTVARDAIRRFFDPEFLNRIDEVVILDTLDHDAARDVARLQVTELRRQLSSRKVELDVPPDVTARLAELGFDPAYGGRSLRRVVRQQLAVPVARVLATAPPGQRPTALRACVAQRDRIDIAIVATTEDTSGHATATGDDHSDPTRPIPPPALLSRDLTAGR